MKSKFVVSHTPRNYYSLGRDEEFGRIVVTPVRGSLRQSSFPRHREARTSRRGVKYPAVQGARTFLPREIGPAVDGFPLRLQTSDGMQYVQRNGTRYRLDKLVASGRVAVQTKAQRP